MEIEFSKQKVPCCSYTSESLATYTPKNCLGHTGEGEGETFYDKIKQTNLTIEKNILQFHPASLWDLSEQVLKSERHLRTP